MKGGSVYIMSNKRYGLKRLVYYEPYDDIRNALQREKNMKHWPRVSSSHRSARP